MQTSNWSTFSWTHFLVLLGFDCIDKECVLKKKKCEEYKATVEEMEQQNNGMIIKIQDMSDTISKAALENKKSSEDHQNSVRSYKEKLEKQDTELKEFRSEAARLKLDLETANVVCNLSNTINLFSGTFENIYPI